MREDRDDQDHAGDRRAARPIVAQPPRPEAADERAPTWLTRRAPTALTPKITPNSCGERPNTFSSTNDEPAM